MGEEECLLVWCGGESDDGLEGAIPGGKAFEEGEEERNQVDIRL